MANVVNLTLKANVAGLGDVKSFDAALRKVGQTAQAADLPLRRVNATIKNVRDAAGNVAPQIDRMTVSFMRASQRLNLFTAAFAGFGRFIVGIFAAQTLIRGAAAFADVADEVTRLESRLRLVTGSSGQLERSWRALLDISQRTRTDIASNVILFQRLKFAQDALGKTDRELLGFTETLTQAIASAGLTTTEATSAVIQITQALNAGRFQGDEFRSVMENMPTVMRAVADRLGVTKGELKGLASQGKITASVFFDAVMDMRRSGEGLGDVPKTIENAFTRLDNKMKDYIAHNRTIISLHSAVVRGIDLVADNFDKLATALVNVVAQLPGFREFFTVMSALQQAEAGPPVRDLLAATESRIKFLKDESAGIREGLSKGVIPENIRADAAQALIDNEAELNRLLRERVLLRAALSGPHGPSGRPRLPGTRPEPPAPPLEEDRATRHLRDYVEQLRFERDQLGRSAEQQAIHNALRQAGTTLATAAGQQIQRLVLDIRALTDAQQDEADEIERVGRAMDTGRGITERYQTPLEAYQRNQRALNDLLAEGAINQDTFNRAAADAQQAAADAQRALLERGTDFASGAKRALSDYAEHATNVGENVENVLGNAFFGAEDALTEFVTRGKADFKDLANSIIADVARMALRISILGPLAKFLSGLINPASFIAPFGFDDVLPVGGVLPGLARGGPAMKGRVYQINETGASEYFIPNSSGRVVPADRAWGGGDVNVSFGDVNVQAAPGANLADPQQAQAVAVELRRAVRAALAEELRQQLRPGNLLNPGPTHLSPAR